jgi:hypothetical protein
MDAMSRNADWRSWSYNRGALYVKATDTTFDASPLAS